MSSMAEQLHEEPFVSFFFEHPSQWSLQSHIPRLTMRLTASTANPSTTRTITIVDGVNPSS